MCTHNKKKKTCHVHLQSPSMHCFSTRMLSEIKHNKQHLLLTIFNGPSFGILFLTLLFGSFLKWCKFHYGRILQTYSYIEKKILTSWLIFKKRTPLPPLITCVQGPVSHNTLLIHINKPGSIAWLPVLLIQARNMSCELALKLPHSRLCIFFFKWESYYNELTHMD